MCGALRRRASTILCRAREGVTIEDVPRQAGQLVPPFCERRNECTAPLETLAMAGESMAGSQVTRSMSKRCFQDTARSAPLIVCKLTRIQRTQQLRMVEYDQYLLMQMSGRPTFHRRNVDRARRSPGDRRAQSSSRTEVPEPGRPPDDIEQPESSLIPRRSR